MNTCISDVQIFFDHYGVALGTGDGEKISNAWSIPSLIANNDTSIIISHKKDVREFFKLHIENLKADGIIHAVPSIESLTEISSNLIAVDIKWTLSTHDGLEKGVEYTHYILRKGKLDTFSIDFFHQQQKNNFQKHVIG